MKYDVVIVGMGIAGMSAALYLKNSGLSICILESDTPGGLLNKISTITNYPGIIKTTGPDLSYELFNNMQNLNIPYKITTVLDILDKKDYQEIITNNETYKSKYVIIATGRKNKKLGLPKEEELLGKGISTCALCDGHLYKDKVIAVVGGGNSALEESIYLSNIVKKIYLIHRRNSFRGEDDLQKEVFKRKNIEILYDSEVTSLLEEDNHLKGIVINNKKTLEVSALFTYIGFTPSHTFLKDIEEVDGYIKVDNHFETNKKGIYAIGDCIKKDVYQLITAASDGVTCAIHIINEIKK